MQRTNPKKNLSIYQVGGLTKSLADKEAVEAELSRSLETAEANLTNLDDLKASTEKELGAAKESLRSVNEELTRLNQGIKKMNTYVLFMKSSDLKIKTHG